MPLFKLGEKLQTLVADGQRSDQGKAGSHPEYRSEMPYFTPTGLGGPDAHMLPLLQPQRSSGLGGPDAHMLPLLPQQRPPPGPDRIPLTTNFSNQGNQGMNPTPNVPRSVTNLGY
jgi:hypothetical protein